MIAGSFLHPITDLLYGSLNNLFMIEWQARKIVDRTPTDRVGFIGREYAFAPQPAQDAGQRGYFAENSRRAAYLREKLDHPGF